MSVPPPQAPPLALARASGHHGCMALQTSDSSQTPVDILRRLENLIRLGTVAEVRHERPARVRIQTGKLLTTWVPWLNLRAGETKDWSPPTAGEQCVLLSPGGDLTQAVAVMGVFSDAHPQNSEHPKETRTTWANGDHMVHNSETGAFDLVCTGPIKIVGSRIDLNP